MLTYKLPNQLKSLLVQSFHTQLCTLLSGYTSFNTTYKVIFIQNSLTIVTIPITNTFNATKRKIYENQLKQSLVQEYLQQDNYSLKIVHLIIILVPQKEQNQIRMSNCQINKISFIKIEESKISYENIEIASPLTTPQECNNNNKKICQIYVKYVCYMLNIGQIHFRLLRNILKEYINTFFVMLYSKSYKYTNFAEFIPISILLQYYQQQQQQYYIDYIIINHSISVIIVLYLQLQYYGYCIMILKYFILYNIVLGTIYDQVSQNNMRLFLRLQDQIGMIQVFMGQSCKELDILGQLQWLTLIVQTLKRIVILIVIYLLPLSFVKYHAIIS
eukprot:TRINITY_DN940_c0_g1_i2.p1 TRINITY_DN940_c0_g1~~TRINITY_DN940_c0_g1_i2.p1  ORF type:complete len:345 (+),score=-24.21 TRINITY_DN940_c0_g1_i2:43-1035(+)